MSLPKSIQGEYPFQQNLYKLNNGFRLNYIDHGKKDNFPTIFLHGNPTWSFFYRKLILSLEDNFRCVAPDHLGCGLSDKPTAHEFEYDLEGHSNNVKELVNSLGFKKFNLVVHDWGGAIGLSAFRDEFERINKLVLLNTAAFLSHDVPKRIRFCRIPVIGELFVRLFNGFARPATWMATKKGISKVIRSGFLYPYKDWKSRVAVWKFVRDIPLEENHPTKKFLMKTEGLLNQLSNTPVLACWGMRDFCFHSGFLNEWNKRLPHIESYSLRDAGHYLLEDDFESCSEKITSFLSQ